MASEGKRSSKGSKIGRNKEKCARYRARVGKPSHDPNVTKAPFKKGRVGSPPPFLITLDPSKRP